MTHRAATMLIMIITRHTCRPMMRMSRRMFGTKLSLLRVRTRPSAGIMMSGGGIGGNRMNATHDDGKVERPRLKYRGQEFGCNRRVMECAGGKR